MFYSHSLFLLLHVFFYVLCFFFFFIFFFFFFFYFLFQAEDGIRDVAVTGVQTCALPIWSHRRRFRSLDRRWIESRPLPRIRAPGRSLEVHRVPVAPRDPGALL